MHQRIQNRTDHAIATLRKIKKEVLTDEMKSEQLGIDAALQQLGYNTLKDDRDKYGDAYREVKTELQECLFQIKKQKEEIGKLKKALGITAFLIAVILINQIYR